MTKDESYIIALYKAAGRGVKNRYEIGAQIGISVRTVNAILNGLAQANFVKKIGDTQVSLTSNGVALAESLLTPK